VAFVKRKELPGTLDFHWAWLNGKPVLWTVAIVIAGVGAMYYAAVQHRKPAHLQAPEGEAVAAESPDIAPAPSV
jgi:hypothetical protein